MPKFPLATLISLPALVPLISSGQVEAGSMVVYVRTLTSLVAVDVDSSDSIENLLQKMQEREGYAPVGMIVRHQGQWMEPFRTLADYNVVDESVIHTSFVTEFVDLDTGGSLPTGSINLADAAGSAGDGWLHFRSSGSYDLAAMDPLFFNINVTSFYRGDDGYLYRGDMANFDPERSYRWEILTAAGGITGFDADLFSVDTAGIMNTFSHDFTVQLSDDGTTMYLAYNVPGPGGLVFCSGLAAIRVRRRR
jgi:hypothetical protein